MLVEAELNLPSGRIRSGPGSVHNLVYQALSAYESISSVRVSTPNLSSLVKSSCHPNAEVSLGGTSAKFVLVLFSAILQCFLLHFSASSKRAAELPGTQHQCTFRAGGGVAYLHRRPEKSEAPRDRPLSCTVAGAGAGAAASPSGARARCSPLAFSVAFCGATRAQPRLRLRAHSSAQPSGRL